MATLEYNEVKPRTYIVLAGEPYECMDSQVSRTQKRKPQNQVKLKSLISGKTMPMTFHASDTAEEADISRREIKYMYTTKGEYWFCNPQDPKDRFKIEESLIADSIKYLKENTECEALVFGDEEEAKIIGVKLPIKMNFKIKEAPPNIKGDTASGGGKVAILETGASVTVPLFIEAGETIVVNTLTGEYTERVKG